MKTKNNAFDYFNIVILAGLAMVVVYPLVYVVSLSVSNTDAVLRGKVLLFPIGVQFRSYQQIFKNPVIWTAYRNTLMYTGLGVIVRLIVLLITAYPLSRKKFIGRNTFMMMITFTMLFSGGMIPTYLLVNALGITDTIWAMILPGAISAYHIIIVRTFFQSTIPESLTESAELDGANDLQTLTRIVAPLSTPIIAVMALFIGVGIWNNFFQALLYLRRAELLPLTVILREIIILAAGEVFETFQAETGYIPPRSVQSATLVVSIVPMLCAYPFIQRYFVKGIMIGAIKG
jgi:putative aldouronate transport system permease protein